MMESEDETCGVCCNPYDADNRIPRVLVNCGHSICACCLTDILKSPQLRKCPFDNLEFERPQKCLENFPVNFALLGLLEGKNRNVCKTHGEKLVMFCLQDEVKICYGCALFGEHKGHDCKIVNDLKAQGMKTRKELEERFQNFEKNLLEKDEALDVLEIEFFSKIWDKFAEIKQLINEKETEFIKQMGTLFERSQEKNTRLLLKGEIDKALEGIDKACHQEENLALLGQDSRSMISNLEPQNVQEETLKFSNQGSKMMECMELFFTNETKSIKNFDLFNETRKQNCSVETKQNPPLQLFKTKTLFALEVQDSCLYVHAENSSPVGLTVNLTEQNKIKKISIKLDKFLSLYQGSVDFNFLSQILTRFTNYISLAVSFARQDLTDYRALGLLGLLFYRIQHLTDIEISFERCEITNQPISFFCTEILPKAASLRNLTLELSFTLVNDLSCFALAGSLAPLSKHLESFTLGAGHTSITDSGVEKILNVILGVKVLDLDLKGTLVKDKSLKVLGNNMMLEMKNLEKFSLNCSRTRITMEGAKAIFEGIPNHLRYLMLDFQKALPDEVVALFEEKVCPKLGMAEEVYLKLQRSDSEVNLAKTLESLRKKNRSIEN